MISNNRDQKQQLFRAVTFGNSSRPRTSVMEPLLHGAHHHENDENDDESEDDGYANDFVISRQQQPPTPSKSSTDCSHINQDTIFHRCKLSALIIGLIVGIVIQFSTLGVNFLAINLWGINVEPNTSSSLQRQVEMFSLLWSVFTSATAILILAALRKVVQVSYLSTLKKTQDVIEEMTLQLECRFVVGALVGVCLSWSIADALMGMTKQIILSLVILAVALVTCSIIIPFLVSNNRSNTNDNDQSSSSSPSGYPTYRRTTRSSLTPVNAIPTV